MSEPIQIRHNWSQLGEFCAAIHKAETFDEIGAALDGLCVMRDEARAGKAEAHYTLAIDVAFDTASRKLRVFITDPALIFKIAP